MVEIKFVGRGGQGAVIASQILAKVFFLMGKYPQCFSVFGGEGGCARCELPKGGRQKDIAQMRDQKAGSMVYMAPDLVDEAEIESTLKPDGLILINNALTTNSYAGLRKYRLALVDALSIAEEMGMGATINTAILGAYARASNDVSMEYLEQAIRETVPAKIEANVAAARRAYESTRLVDC